MCSAGFIPGIMLGVAVTVVGILMAECETDDRQREIDKQKEERKRYRAEVWRRRREFMKRTKKKLWIWS